MKQLTGKHISDHGTITGGVEVFIDDKDWDDWIEWFIGSLTIEQQHQVHLLLHREDV